MSMPQRYLRAPRSIRPQTSVAEAARSMQEHGIGSLVVVEDARVVGMVTDRDIALHALRSGRAFDELRVSDCMTAPAATLLASASILDAVRTMRREAVRRLPIVDDEDRPVGFVAADDLVGELARDLHWVAETAVRGPENEARPEPRGGSIFGRE